MLPIQLQPLVGAQVVVFVLWNAAVPPVGNTSVSATSWSYLFVFVGLELYILDSVADLTVPPNCSGHDDELRMFASMRVVKMSGFVRVYCIYIPG